MSAEASGKTPRRFRVTLRRQIVKEVETDDYRATVARFKRYAVVMVEDLGNEANDWMGTCESCGQPLFDDDRFVVDEEGIFVHVGECPVEP